MNIKLSVLTSDAVDIIKRDWYKQLDELESDGSYLYSSVERIVDWCEKSILEDGHCLYSLDDSEKKSVRAIVEIADASKAKDPSFKFLNIYMEPSLVNSLQMALKKGTRKLKVYARTDEMKNMFDSLVLTANPQDSGATLYRQGRWLVIEAQ